MRVKERKRKSAKERAKGAKRKIALPRKNCKQPGLGTPGIFSGFSKIRALGPFRSFSWETSLKANLSKFSGVGHWGQKLAVMFAFFCAA